jgi:menaquinone-dependent protoporphyrinogen IX oxidase
MKALVVYESMYGNTHLVANAIADGLRRHMDATVVPVRDADAALVADADVVIIGGPTHAHGMSHASTRKGAVEAAEKPGSELVLDAGDDPDAYGEGLREWFDALPAIPTSAAAFDTRVEMPAVLTGRASKGIARKLRHHGAALLAEPESFFVTKANRLEPDEETRAREWGDRLGGLVDADAR